MAELVVRVEVAAPAADAWAALVDWETHQAWMLLTRVEPTTGPTTEDGEGVGAGIVGVTGIGPLAFRDTMTVTQWEPPPANPARCVVAHTGDVVRGSGAFEVEAIDAGRCRVIWSEWVRPPFGILGAAGFVVVVRPLARLFLAVSLRRLARRVEGATGR